MIESDAINRRFFQFKLQLDTFTDTEKGCSGSAIIDYFQPLSFIVCRDHTTVLLLPKRFFKITTGNF